MYIELTSFFVSLFVDFNNLQLYAFVLRNIRFRVNKNRSEFHKHAIYFVDLFS